MTFPGRIPGAAVAIDESAPVRPCYLKSHGNFVNEIELLLVEPKRDGKFQTLTVLVGNERFMNSR